VQLHRFDSIDKFWNETQAYLLQHEAENNVLLGIIHTLRYNPARYPAPHYLGMVEIDGEIVATAIRTPPHKLLLSKVSNLDALTLMVEDLRQERLLGVMGLLPEVEIFVRSWQAITGQSYQLSTAMKIHQLQAVQPAANATGFLRLATESDRALLLKWLPAFNTEIGFGVSEDAELLVANRLNERHTYIWEDDTPVALAAGRKFSDTASRIGSVYTPPAERRKGYATACVAALSQKLLDEGCNRCFLLTDLENPTSNHIYRQIGYIPVCDWLEYSFIS
jgi:uncharacterized protein